MADQLQLEVVTPERRLLSESVNAVTVPGRNGEMQILPGHAALISELKTGVLTYNQGGTNVQLHVSGGFIEVNDDRVSVLSEIAERPDEIDIARARLDSASLIQGPPRRVDRIEPPTWRPRAVVAIPD